METQSKTCYVCKKQFICPCQKQNTRFKERCCAVGQVQSISRMFKTPQGIIYIHLCSKKCQKSLPNPYDDISYYCQKCNITEMNAKGKQEAKKSHACKCPVSSPIKTNKNIYKQPMNYQNTLQQLVNNQLDAELKHKFKMYTGFDADDRNQTVFTPQKRYQHYSKQLAFWCAQDGKFDVNDAYDRCRNFLIAQGKVHMLTMIEQRFSETQKAIVKKRVQQLLEKTKPLQSCGWCKKVQTQLLSCGKCKKIKYCGKQCQAADWKSNWKPHSKDCKSN